MTHILQQPIPDLSYQRDHKRGYRDYPLDSAGARNQEPLVDIAEYGIAGQSYYSRPNTATGKPIPGVPQAVMLRRSVAEKLAAINYSLQASEVVAQLLGGRVELFVDEGLRSREVQAYLYDKAFPRLISKRHPELSRDEVLKLRSNFIAQPSDETSPAPHATGAAIDIKLRYVQDDQGFVPDCFVDVGYMGGALGELAYPDYFEHPGSGRTGAKHDAARRNRRVFYWIMRGALMGDDSGFEVNPHEWWHWSFGDQLWAQLHQAPCAFFGLPPHAEE